MRPSCRVTQNPRIPISGLLISGKLRAGLCPSSYSTAITEKNAPSRCRILPSASDQSRQADKSMGWISAPVAARLVAIHLAIIQMLPCRTDKVFKRRWQGKAFAGPRLQQFRHAPSWRKAPRLKERIKGINAATQIGSRFGLPQTRKGLPHLQIGRTRRHGSTGSGTMAFCNSKADLGRFG